MGAGVVGLTCAVRLLEAGHRVDVLARDLPRETTSAVAAALWYPYRALPQDRVTAWAARTFVELERLARLPRTGVDMVPGTEVQRRPQGEPWWSSAVPDLRRGPAGGTELPQGYAEAWSFTAPVVEMPVFLDWLVARVAELGGTITRHNLSALPLGRAAGRAGGGPDVVVDCAGLGSRHLAADPTVVPVRGQVLRLAQVGLDRWWLDAEGPTYVVPRSRDIVVGGTDQEGEWSRTPDPATAEEVLARAVRLVPQLARARVLSHRVGLRPVRPRVRLERVEDVIHCYGHGGAGVTLSWGCAAEVAALV